ncbi:MAG: S-layer homology domain-containing protein [Clostridia bacterium]|nr:S-layer homology domain-containing protein [Clostridia bacterium]
MIASFGCIAYAKDFSDVASTASYADAVNLLSNLGIITGYEDGTFRPDETITRAETATIMVRMLGMDDNIEQGDSTFTDVSASDWFSGYVNKAWEAGIINGMGDGTFAPNDNVTYEQVVKMLVCALGYEPAATAAGDYPTGYLAIAANNKIGLVKGVSGTVGQAASRATVAKLVYNALEIELMDQTEWTTGINGGTWSVQEGKTILSEYLEMEKVDGVVVSTYISDPDYDIDDDRMIDIVVTKNYAEDEGNTSTDYPAGDRYSFVANQTDAATFLGYTVVAYAGEDDDGNDAIFAVAEKSGRNSTTVVDVDLFATDNTNWEISEGDAGLVGTVVYYKSDSAKTTSKAKLENTIKGYYASDDELEQVDNIIINGFLRDDYDDSVATDFAFETLEDLGVDDVTFIDNDSDGDFEYVIVNIYSDNGQEFVVDSIDLDDLYLEGMEGEGLELDYDENLITIIRDGEIVEFSEIQEGDTVTVLDDSQTVLTLYVSSTIIEGTIDEVDDDEYTINGNEYKISTYTDYVDEDDLSAGDEGVFYINAFGKIAYADDVNSIASADYYYIIDASENEGDFGDIEYLIKVVTHTGSIEVLTLKTTKVDVYDSDGSFYDDLDDDEAWAYISQFEDTLDGSIIKLDLDSTGKVKKIYLPGADDFNEYTKYENDAEDEDRTYSESRGTYGTYTLPSDIVVFNIDTDEDDLEDAVTASTVGNIFVDDSSYSFKAYGKDLDNIDALVTTDAKTAFDPEAPVMVVTKTSQVTNGDDDTWKLTGMVAGSTVSVVVDPDEDQDPLAEIEKGNVIIYSTNTAGLAENVYVLFDANEDSLGTIQSETDKIVLTPSDDDVNIAAGWVVEKKSSYFRISDIRTDEITDDEIEDIEEMYVPADEGCNYTVVEKTGNSITVTKGSSASVKKSVSNPLYVFIKTVEDAEDEVTDVVIYKGYDE